MKEYIVNRDNDISIRFTGELIAFAESTENKSLRTHPYSYNISTTFFLYKTKGGKFVCEKYIQSGKYGVADKHSGLVCETFSKVYKFFGAGSLAQEIYKTADFPVQDIE